MAVGPVLLPVLAGVVAGALAGGGLVWLLLRGRRPPAVPAPEAEGVEAMVLTTRRLCHDVRGALAPAMLAADRLSSHPDEQVRRPAELILQSLERGADLMRRPWEKG